MSVIFLEDGLPTDTSASHVFISHASHDKPLISLFGREILEQALGLSPESMFNISADVSPLEAGVDFGPRIRQALADCKIVLAFVSESYFRSPFCMAELGAAWFSQKLVPVVVPPVSFASLRGVLSGLQCLQLDNEDAVSSLFDEIERRLPGVRRRGLRQVNEQISKYLKAVPEILSSIQLNEATEAQRGQPVRSAGAATPSPKDLVSLASKVAGELDSLGREWSSGFKQRSGFASQLILTRAQTLILEVLQLTGLRDEWRTPLVELYVVNRALHKLADANSGDKKTDLESEGGRWIKIAAEKTRELK
ncbi:toll/interleukin-1 receptor domain-containing protein [Pyxidicoccus sp. 3LG]